VALWLGTSEFEGPMLLRVAIRLALEIHVCRIEASRAVGLYCAKTTYIVLRSPGHLVCFIFYLLSYGHIGQHVYTCAL
jgi:hypothetical protein